MPVIFIEEPWLGVWQHRQVPEWDERPGMDRVRVFRPLVPTAVVDTPGNSYQEIFTRMVVELLHSLPLTPVVWEYSPMMVYLVEHARPNVVVYDCMDELSAFLGAPSTLKPREQQLMQRADLVFTAGRSMYEARKGRHAAIYCFPAGVDAAHYRAALNPELPEPSDAAVPHPRLGYFGVLDERLDWDLIGAVAERRPDWHWLFVGPLAKVEMAELPQGPNLHYLGQRPYNDLPAYLRSFDVATMPFAMNDATRFISPTKTLEYMAGHAPIVSTPVPDVVHSYAQAVHVANGPASFIAAVEAALSESRDQCNERNKVYDRLVGENSWDTIADQMWQLVKERLMLRPFGSSDLTR
ncbi:MAG: glycosyltransferase family 1 protein [Herpetosiphon sp.]